MTIRLFPPPHSSSFPIILTKKFFPLLFFLKKKDTSSSHLTTVVAIWPVTGRAQLIKPSCLGGSHFWRESDGGTKALVICAAKGISALLFLSASSHHDVVPDSSVPVTIAITHSIALQIDPHCTSTGTARRGLLSSRRRTGLFRTATIHASAHLPCCLCLRLCSCLCSSPCSEPINHNSQPHADTRARARV